MEQYELVYDRLRQLEIPYDIVEHPPALTTADADLYIVGQEGVRTKTLFLCNRKSTAFYLVIMDGAKRLDMKKLEEIINEKGMRFCSPEKLMAKMSLEPGMVSLFGLINNAEHDIRVCLDREMLSEKRISFHPNINTKTVFITIEDMHQFLTALEYEYKVIDL